MSKRIINIFLIFSICVTLCFDCMAQIDIDSLAESIDKNNYPHDSLGINTEIDIDSLDFFDQDPESDIIEPKNYQEQQAVDIVHNILDIILDLEQNDTIEEHFAFYQDNSLFRYEGEIPTDSLICQKFDILRGRDEEEYDFTFIRETIYNDNRGAWDYIYERVYNHEGKLIYFVRRYNTYNSACAEVAFERSEYYYNENSTLVQKTYEIFDSNNIPLNAEECFMTRESYEKYLTLTEFLLKYPLQ